MLGGRFGPDESAMTQDHHPRDEERAQLRDYLAVLRVRRWSVVVVVALVVAGALAYSARQTPLYQSRARILIQPFAAGTTTVQPTRGSLETERELARTVPVAEVAAQRLGTEDPPGSLLDGLSVNVVTQTEIMEFVYLHPSPTEAQRRAQAFAQGYLQFRRQQVVDDLLSASEALQDRLQTLNRQLSRIQTRISEAEAGSPQITDLQTRANRLSGQIGVLEQEIADLTPADSLRVGQLVEPASLPSSPAHPDYARNAVLAVMLGLVLGIAVAFLRERLDDSLRGRHDLERNIRAPVLSIIPRISAWKRDQDAPLVTIDDPRSPPAEAFRTLRTSLLFAAAQRDVKTILVTSAHAGEGKTFASVNLAVTLAQARKRVILVSADLRKPRAHRFFGSEGSAGLTGVLIGEARPWEAVQDVGIENLKLLPSGPVPGNPSELLGSDAMARLLLQFREVADFVIVDSAPVLVVADALTLSPACDAVLFVADAAGTSRGAVSQARQQMDQVAARILGSVLNDFDPSKSAATSYWDYSYVYEYRDVSAKPRRFRRQAPPPPSGFEPDVPDPEVIWGRSGAGQPSASAEPQRKDGAGQDAEGTTPADPSAEGGKDPRPRRRGAIPS
jgi:capsular exopolysaccharide synthesis family protein